MSLNITTLQRNDRCYCSSTKKYKACCLRKDEEFHTKYYHENVVIFHDMAFTDGEITDAQFNDGRVSMASEDDIKAATEIQDYFVTQASHAPEQATEYLNKILALIDKNQQEPVLYNILYNAYLVLDRESDAIAALETTTTKFPYYFFGKANVARKCLYNNDLKGIFETFHQSYTLRQLYPQRELFHVSEARNFHCLMSMSLLPTLDFEKTRFQTRVFRKLNELCGHDKHPDEMAREFERFFELFFQSMGETMGEADYQDDHDESHGHANCC